MPARKLTSAAAAASLAGVALLGLAGPASAQVYPPAAPAVISDAAVVAGQTVTVVAPAGSFTPGTTVTVTVPGLDISGTTQSAGDGGASFDFVVPANAPAGDFEVIFSGAGGPDLSVPFAVLDAGVAQPAPVVDEEDTEVSQGSVLPRTGSDEVIPLTLAGAALVGVGGALVLVARRRRTSVTPAGLA